MQQSCDDLSCDQVLDWMEPWIDGELDDALAREMRRHLDQCPECQAECHAAEDVKTQLRGLVEFDLPRKVADAVRSKTVGDPRSVWMADWMPRGGLRSVAAAAAIGVVVFLVGVIAPRRQAPPLQPNVEDVESVAAETRLALAYLGDVARRAEEKAAARVIEGRAVVATMNDMSSSLKWVLGPGPESEEKPPIEGSS